MLYMFYIICTNKLFLAFHLINVIQNHKHDVYIMLSYQFILIHIYHNNIIYWELYQLNNRDCHNNDVLNNNKNRDFLYILHNQHIYISPFLNNKKKSILSFSFLFFNWLSNYLWFFFFLCFWFGFRLLFLLLFLF